MIIKIQFTEAEIKQLDYERYHHPRPCVQRKMEALWLKSQGASHQDIYKYAGISAKNLFKIFSKWLTKFSKTVNLAIDEN